MNYSQPIKQILLENRSLWDHAQTRPCVRENFRRIIDCRTSTLGAEVYSSGTEEKLVFHTCKSRACPSCGYRATLLWQREQWAALPDIPYSGIVLTMPHVLWPIFQQNRHLLHDLPAVGAAVIQQWVKAKYGVQVLIIVVPHTFGRKLNFNAHLHVLVSAMGVHEPEGRLVSVRFNKKALMHMWRYAVTTYLREVLAAGVLQSDLSPYQLRNVLTNQYERWWNIDISRFQSKAHFLRYAGRYVRRPPIAQRRFTKISDQDVEFWTKDLKEKRVVATRYSVADFLKLLAEHVLDRYMHAIRYFGLLASRSKHRTFLVLFLLLKQAPRPRPQRLSWQESLRKSFGFDPLVDSLGQPMRWVRRLSPNHCAI